MKQEPTWMVVWKLIAGITVILLVFMCFLSVSPILDSVTEWGDGEITGREMAGQIAGDGLYIGLLAMWKFINLSGVWKVAS